MKGRERDRVEKKDVRDIQARWREKERRDENRVMVCAPVWCV